MRIIAFNADLATTIFRAFPDERARWLCEWANEVGIADPQTGSRLKIQRFAAGARLYRTRTRDLRPRPASRRVFVASSDGQSARFIREHKKSVS